MEALSPRSGNIQLRAQITKQKAPMDDDDAKKAEAEAAKKALKEKDSAPVPPEWVFQLPLVKGGLAEKYRNRTLLGQRRLCNLL
ncbi:hypothetical protein MMC28_008049 [Mycoblastus sanguinarius]|nr:hypothetical protein [Mycoblastus sanguinarius]